MIIQSDHIIVFLGLVATAWMIFHAFSPTKKPQYVGRKPKWRPKPAGQTSTFNRPNQSNVGSSVGDSANQLRIVIAADFTPRRVLSPTEARVFRAAEKSLHELQPTWRLLAQVSLGEILSSTDRQAYSSINSKRVDMLIVSEDSMPIAAIEFQGTGHYLGDAAARDAVKKEALRRAGIGYIEIVARDGAADVHTQISRFVKSRA
jgi:Asp-tRNA(Asn)/Glu-tRNA(Gln) amidotransferase A subunit family amidase